jgi:Recombination directionality factor-like
LVCKSMHDYVNPKTQQNMGSVAAFFKVGQEVSGLTQEQFPGMARSRVRQCAYKMCPDYISGNCTEHMFLNLMVPQYSMGALFTLDSTSINAVINVLSCFQKSALRYQGKISGQIYRLFKKKAPINFQNKDGSMSKRDTDVVHMENVSFAEYEAKFRSQIAPEDWDALMFIRSRGVGLNPSDSANIAALPSQSQELIEAADQSAPAQLTTSLTNAAAQTDEDAIKLRAEDPAVSKYFEEISALVGKENTLEIRMATAKAFPDVQALATYLKNKIREHKKSKKDVTQTQPPPQSGQPAKGATAERPLF